MPESHPLLRFAGSNSNQLTSAIVSLSPLFCSFKKFCASCVCVEGEPSALVGLHGAPLQDGRRSTAASVIQTVKPEPNVESSQLVNEEITGMLGQLSTSA
jgi:hypothetical protein